MDDITICPGCGGINSIVVDATSWECKNCGYGSDDGDGLPTLAWLLDTPNGGESLPVLTWFTPPLDFDDVNLQAFARALWVVFRGEANLTAYSVALGKLVRGEKE